MTQTEVLDRLWDSLLGKLRGNPSSDYFIPIGSNAKSGLRNEADGHAFCDLATPDINAEVKNTSTDLWPYADRSKCEHWVLVRVRR